MKTEDYKKTFMKYNHPYQSSQKVRGFTVLEIIVVLGILVAFVWIVWPLPLYLISPAAREKKLCAEIIKRREESEKAYKEKLAWSNTEEGKKECERLEKEEKLMKKWKEWDKKYEDYEEWKKSYEKRKKWKEWDKLMDEGKDVRPSVVGLIET